MRHLFPYSW